MSPNVSTPAFIETDKWIKSRDVAELLSVSMSTVRNLRKKGILNYTKVNGTLYYSYKAVWQLMNERVPAMDSGNKKG